MSVAVEPPAEPTDAPVWGYDVTHSDDIDVVMATEGNVTAVDEVMGVSSWQVYDIYVRCKD